MLRIFTVNRLKNSKTFGDFNEKMYFCRKFHLNEKDRRTKRILSMAAVTFTPAQIHVLNMASRLKTEHGLERLQDQLAKFYADLIDQEMDELWESGAWNEEKLEELRHAHFRTAYK